MDRNMPQLFSRGPSPPLQSHQPYSNQGLTHGSSPNQIDSLFQNLSSSSSQRDSSDTYGNSEPATPVMSLADESISSTSVQGVTTTDRQSALLNLLGSVSARTGAAAAQSQPQPQPQPQPQSQSQSQSQQIPTPPASSQRSGASPPNNESQGKILLEQLMSGNAPRSNYADSQRGVLPSSGAAPSPPYAQPSSSTSTQRETESYLNRETSFNPHEASREVPERSQPQPQNQPQPQSQPQSQQPQQPQQQPQQPPSPRKSMFDFVSPFDALSQSSQVKKKPVPTQPASGSSGNEDSWTSVSVSTDPRRKSVDNLSQLTGRPTAQAPAQSYEAYLAGEDLSDQVPRVPPPPLPPKPNRIASPRLSPPKVNAAQRPQQQRSGESPITQQAVPMIVNIPITSGRREKESSPGPRGSNWKPEVRGKASLGKGKVVSSPSPQAQSIVFDVSQPLDEVQAPRDAVKSTAIALVKQDAVFLPGTTIGATHWVAYAMTRGRVRVISRSSGDRTLLQLPVTFPSSATVTDMAVYGNRLAGVTSDGGFVVWELPELITDDVPGQLLLCVTPSSDSDALHSVKWHPKQPDTLAVASENKIYLVDLAEATRISRIQASPQTELHRIAQLFSVPSRLVAFDFDVLHFALATISEDSTLTLWNIRDKLPFWTHRVRGDETPSSLTFIDGGIIVGRKNGTMFQLFSVTAKSVLSTIKFVNGTQEDNDMFGHVNYDSRIQTLWVANCRRDSMIAFKINLESSAGGEEASRGYFEQVVEFAGPKPTIHFVILTADADPTGDEAHAACVAAKVPPGELALVAFSVHSSGVDQILIRKEWFDAALASTLSKFPSYTLPQTAQAPQGLQTFGAEHKTHPSSSQMEQNSRGIPRGALPSLVAPPARLRTPPSEDVEGDIARDEVRSEAKGKGTKGKVNFKDREDSGKEKEKDKNTKLTDISETSVALGKEIRKLEESLHTRIGRLIGKEMDKQHQRLEEARAHEQAEDFARQEKILKLISNELTRNTTRVVEMAVKNEVQNSVLPSLENITKNEVKAALNDQIGRNLADFIQQSLPMEIEKLLLRPDISNHFAHLLSSNLTPLIERNVKDTISKTFMPAFSQQSSSLHQELLRELRSEIHNVKKELIGWQNDAFRGQESLIRDLEHTVRSLSDQVKFLSMNASASLHHHNSPGPSSSQHPQGNMSQTHIRQPNHPPVSQVAPSYSQSHGSFQQQTQPAMPWFSSAIAAPQASHPAAPPPPPPPPPLAQRTPPAKSEDWDETYLAVLGTQDARQLRELLARSNPEIVMPLNGPGPLSQAVILTLLHRIAALVGETPPVDESFKSSVWWLQRTATTLNTNDPLISPYVPRVVPNVQQMLNTTKQRLAILPGGPQLLDTARTLSDIQDTLGRKP